MLDVRKEVSVTLTQQKRAEISALLYFNNDLILN